jgi:hypothetical protein
MRGKLITITAVLAAGVAGFWLGFCRTRQVWDHIAQRRVDSQYHTDNRNRAQVMTQALKCLADGKQTETRALLERQLDVALIKVVAYENLYCPEGRDGTELMVVREARDYRAQHPWESQPDVVKALTNAFQWAD